VFHLKFPPGTSEPDTITEFQQLRRRWQDRRHRCRDNTGLSIEAPGWRDAHDLAVSLMASYGGSALLASTFRDPDILAGEASSQPLDRHALTSHQPPASARRAARAPTRQHGAPVTRLLVPA
jgi:hypothetical protein